MYQERMFESWKKGLLYLAIIIALPIISIITYLKNQDAGVSYFYVLMLTVIIPFLYEFMCISSDGCSTFLKVESILCSIALIGMLIWDFFSLINTYSQGNSTPERLVLKDYLLVFIFIIPVVVVVIEIIRSIIHDIKSKKFLPAETNLVKGASSV